MAHALGTRTITALALALASCATPLEDALDDLVEGDASDEDEEHASTSDAIVQKTNAADDIIAHGAQHLGDPYVFGASASSTTSFDCSSFVKHLFASEAGIVLPRSSYAQSQRGRAVSLSALQKGDLVFFKATSRSTPVDHVAIYAGDGRILHTYKKGIGVTYSSFSGYWKQHAVSARRVLE
jgi:cell wall-associated NlpC family hydrolase